MNQLIFCQNTRLKFGNFEFRSFRKVQKISGKFRDTFNKTIVPLPLKSLSVSNQVEHLIL